MEEERSGYFELILYSLLVGSVGVFVRLVQGLDLYTIVFFRAAIAFCFVLALVIFRNKLKDLFLVSPLETFAVGVLQGLGIFFYLSAVLQTTVSNAVFLLYTAPIFSVFLAKLFLKEKIEKETLVGVFVAILGIALVLDPTTFSLSSASTWGNILGLASGFFYASMAVLSKSFMKKVSPFYIVFWQYFIIAILFAFFAKVSIPIVFSNWWQLLAIGVVCTGVSFLLFMDGVRKVKAQKVFVVTSLEPLTGTLAALLLLNELPSAFTIIGGLLILFGVYLVTTKKNKIK